MLIFQLVRKVAAQVISTTRYPYDALVKLLFDGESLNPNRCAASIAGTLSDTCVFGTKSLQITANTDGITVPHTSFELQQYMRYGDWSLEAMVDFDSLSDGDDGETAAGNGVIPVFAKWYTFGATNADNSFILYVNTSGYLQLYFNDSRLATATATSTISLTGFRKVVLSRFRNNLCVHVDGVLVIRADVYGALNWSTADTQPYHKFYIGSWYDAGTGFHRELEGRIEGVRFTVGASIYSSADYDYKEYDVVDSMNEPQPDCLVLPADSSIQEAYGRTVTKFGGIALAADGSMEFDGVGKYITVAMGGTDKACKFAECEVQITGNFTNLTNGGVVLSTSGWALRLVQVSSGSDRYNIYFADNGAQTGWVLVAQRIIIKWNSWVKVGLFQIRDAAANSAGVCFTVDRQIVGHLPHNYTLAGSTLYVGCYSGGGFMYSGKIRNVKVFRGWSPLTMRSIVSTSLPTATATTVALVTTSLVNQVSGRSVTVINNVSMSGYNKYGSPSILMGSNSGLYLDGRDVMLGDGSDFEISMEIYLTAYPSNYAIVMGKFFNYALKDNRNSFLVQMGTSGELFLSVASNGQMQTSAYSPVYAVASNGSYKTCGCMLNTPHIVTVRKVGNCYKMLLDGKVLKTQYIDGNITWVAPNDGDQYGRLWFGSWINAAYRPITGSILWIKVDKSRVDDYPETVV